MPPPLSCCHLHEASLNSAVHSLREQMKSDAGGDSTVGGVLRSPGSPSGALPESSMFSALDQSTSFVSEAGVLAFPFEASHFVSKQINSLHIATLLPGRTRGNHLHERHPEVIVLVHGAFLLRVASIGNEVRAQKDDSRGNRPALCRALACCCSASHLLLRCLLAVCYWRDRASG